MEPVSQLTALQVVTLAVIAGGIATMIGAIWWYLTERAQPGTDGNLWRRIEILEARAAAQEAEIDALREEKIADRAQISGLKTELDDLYHGVKVLTEQLEIAGLTPVWRTHRRSPSTRIEDRAALAELIADRFSREEMAGLALDIGVEAENLGGDSRAERARQLVDTARRLDKMSRLERRVRELRPESGAD